MSAKRKNSFSRVKSAVFGKKAIFRETRTFGERGDYQVSAFGRESDKDGLKFRMESVKGDEDIALKLSAEDVERFSKSFGTGNNHTSPEWISAFLDIVSITPDANEATINWSDGSESNDPSSGSGAKMESTESAKGDDRESDATPLVSKKIAFTAELNKALLGKGPPVPPSSKDADDSSRAADPGTNANDAQQLINHQPELAKPIIPPGHRRKPTAHKKMDYEELEHLDTRIARRRSGDGNIISGQRCGCVLC